jgi:D-arabinose 1-dehydrogenase-like Zn-dependent alcohol dehydrogenase
MSLPKTYRAVRVESKAAPFKIIEVELKQPKEGEVLIKTLACGVCHSDYAAQQGIFGNPLYVNSLLLVLHPLKLTFLAPSFPAMK